MKVEMKRRFWSLEHGPAAHRAHDELTQVKWKRLIEADRIWILEWEPAYA